MADSTISNDDISANLPEGADVTLTKAPKGGDQVTVFKNLDGGEFTVKGEKTGVVGQRVENSTFEARGSKGSTEEIVFETEGVFNTTIANKGKGTLKVSHKTGDFKNSTIDAGANKKRNDFVKFDNATRIIRGDIKLGKGNDTIRFKKNAEFQKKTTVDLGKGGADVLQVKAIDGVEGGKLQVNTFTKKDELTIGKTTFDYKDIKGGADLPGNIKVDLA